MSRPTTVRWGLDRWRPALWAGLAVGGSATAGLLGGVVTGSPLSVQLGTTITRAGMDVAGVTCVGLTLLAVFLPRPERLPGAALRTREQVRTALDRLLVATAGGWVALVLLSIAFRAADAFGRAVDAAGRHRAAGLEHQAGRRPRPAADHRLCARRARLRDRPAA